MGIDPARRREADHLLKPRGVIAEQALRHPARADDLLPVIEVVDEGIERADPLFDPAFQPPPFARADDARHGVERDEPLLGLVLAIDVEGNSRLAEVGFGIDMLA